MYLYNNVARGAQHGWKKTSANDELCQNFSHDFETVSRSLVTAD